MTLHIRSATNDDHAAVRRIHLAAFPGVDEADLVDALRAGDHVLLSLLAEVGGQVVGHILFTRMGIDTGNETIDAVSLAPMAVLPDFQGRGIGSALVEAGLEGLRDHKERIVVVLGHPEYYPRFGFRPELAANLESPWTDCEAFMALELEEDALEGVCGEVRYAEPFGIG